MDELKKKISFLEVQDAEEKKQKEKQRLISTDPYFLDKYVETLPLLEPEVKRLQALFPHHPTEQPLVERLKFLKEGQNKILLVEEKRLARGPLYEVEERLHHPVEMNEEELKKLLVLVEGVTIHPYSPRKERPELSVLEFDLKKKKNFSGDEMYGVDLKLLMVTR